MLNPSPLQIFPSFNTVEGGGGEMQYIFQDYLCFIRVLRNNLVPGNKVASEERLAG